MIILTTALQRSITNDWVSINTQFMTIQPLWIGRRVGPLVQGICLERDSSNAFYLPILFVHSLCRPFPVLTLNLGRALTSKRTGAPERIPVKSHNTMFKDASDRLLASSLLPTQGNWTVPQVLAAHNAYRELGRPDSRYPVSLMEDGVSLLAWLGKNEDAVSLATHYFSIASQWPANVLARYGDAQKWHRFLNDIAKSTEKLRGIVDEQAKALNVNRLPVSHVFP